MKLSANIKKFSAIAATMLLVACGAEYMNFKMPSEVLPGQTFPVNFEFRLGGTMDPGQTPAGYDAYGCLAIHVPDGWTLSPAADEALSDEDLMAEYAKLYTSELMPMGDGETAADVYNEFKSKGYLVLYRYADEARTIPVDRHILIPNRFYTDLANDRFNEEKVAHFGEKKNKGTWWGFTTAEELNWDSREVNGMRIKYEVNVAETAQVGDVYRMDAVIGESHGSFLQYYNEDEYPTFDDIPNPTRDLSDELLLFRQGTFNFVEDDFAYGITEGMSPLSKNSATISDITIVEKKDLYKTNVAINELAKLHSISAITMPSVVEGGVPFDVQVRISNADVKGETGLNLNGYRTFAIRLPKGWHVVTPETVTEVDLLAAYDVLYTPVESMFGSWPKVDSGSVREEGSEESGQAVYDAISHQGAIVASFINTKRETSSVLFIPNVCVSNVANYRYSPDKVEFDSAIDPVVNASAQWVGFSTTQQFGWTRAYAAITFNLRIVCDDSAEYPSNYTYRLDVLSGVEDSFLTYEGFGRVENDKAYENHFDLHMFDMGTFCPNDGFDFLLVDPEEAPEPLYMHSVRCDASDKMSNMQVTNKQSGIKAVNVANNAADAKYFNMQGVRVSNPTAPGVYLRRAGDRTDKIVVK